MGTLQSGHTRGFKRFAQAVHSATCPHGSSRALMTSSKHTQHSPAFELSPPSWSEPSPVSSSQSSSPPSSSSFQLSMTGHRCQRPESTPPALRDHSPRSPLPRLTRPLAVTAAAFPRYSTACPRLLVLSTTPCTLALPDWYCFVKAMRPVSDDARPKIVYAPTASTPSPDTLAPPPLLPPPSEPPSELKFNENSATPWSELPWV
mmetsp:Transcript_36635/g.74383  ORF Transcript_36635/g.74383 Transcript_36635/m.74383 type:complete len:204 (+) Transcript_36635:278-889(+)